MMETEDENRISDIVSSLNRVMLSCLVRYYVMRVKANRGFPLVMGMDPDEHSTAGKLVKMGLLYVADKELTTTDLGGKVAELAIVEMALKTGVSVLNDPAFLL